MAATVNGLDADELQAMASVIRTRMATESEWERFSRQELEGMVASISGAMLHLMNARLHFALRRMDAEYDEVGE